MNTNKVIQIIMGVVIIILLVIIGIFYSNNRNLTEENNELKEQKSSVCTKDNSCKFKTPGSGFRCDAEGNYSSNGDYYCECTVDCEVEIK